MKKIFFCQVLSNSGQINQIVVSNPVLAQELLSGKAQIATVNDQQVIVKNVGGTTSLVQVPGRNIILRRAVAGTKQPQQCNYS